MYEISYKMRKIENTPLLEVPVFCCVCSTKAYYDVLISYHRKADGHSMAGWAGYICSDICFNLWILKNNDFVRDAQ